MREGENFMKKMLSSHFTKDLMIIFIYRAKSANYNNYDSAISICMILSNVIYVCE